MKRKTMLTRMNILVYGYGIPVRKYKALTHERLLYGHHPCRCLVYRDILAIQGVSKKSLQLENSR